jgi:GNAT superfamily N-acetyltransferase
MPAPVGTTRIHTLRDGRRILVRPVVPADRERLVQGYAALSATSRRARFGVAPDHLSASRLDQLVDLDYDDRFALAAVAVDEPGEPGLGVARYLRRHDDPTVAEAAVVVLDEQQGRGIATILLESLAEVARAHGIATLTGTVMWDNTPLLDAARAAGATITPAEPGVATVQLRLPKQLHRRLA